MTQSNSNKRNKFIHGGKMFKEELGVHLGLFGSPG